MSDAVIKKVILIITSLTLSINLFYCDSVKSFDENDCSDYEQNLDDNDDDDTDNYCDQGMQVKSVVRTNIQVAENGYLYISWYGVCFLKDICEYTGNELNCVAYYKEINGEWDRNSIIMPAISDSYVLNDKGAPIFFYPISSYDYYNQDCTGNSLSDEQKIIPMNDEAALPPSRSYNLNDAFAIDENSIIHYVADAILGEVNYFTCKSNRWEKTMLYELKSGYDYLSSGCINIITSNENNIFILLWDYDLIMITNQSGGWQNETVATSISVGISSLALDKNGSIHISYDFNPQIGYITNKTGEWLSETILDDSGIENDDNQNDRIQVTRKNQIFINHDGNPVIVWNLISLPSYFISIKENNQWITEEIPVGQDAAPFGFSATMDNADKIHISAGIPISCPPNNNNNCFHYMTKLVYITNESGDWTIIELGS